MTLIKRVFLFMAVNLLVVLTLSITLQILGVRPYLSARGIDYGSLAVFCLVWGMGGAFISLALSRIIAKWSMSVQIIDPREASGRAAKLVEMVHRLARSAGLSTMPEVGIYPSAEVNAFATGPTSSRALVAVSAGILDAMDDAALEGVLGHEISHIANGDMVTMTLLQGVVNAFVMFLARVIAFAMSQSSRDGERSSSSPYMLIFVLEIGLSFLGMMVVAAFSRYREYRADAGGARLAGTPKMILALRALQRSVEMVDTRQTAVATLKISSRGGFFALMSTHPPLEERIARLSAV